MVMSPDSMILPVTVLYTSRSEKPVGETAKAREVRMPVLTSRLSSWSM